jgi:hypothetical protein
MNQIIRELKAFNARVVGLTAKRDLRSPRLAAWKKKTVSGVINAVSTFRSHSGNEGSIAPMSPSRCDLSQLSKQPRITASRTWWKLTFHSCWCQAGRVCTRGRCDRDLGGTLC